MEQCEGRCGGTSVATVGCGKINTYLSLSVWEPRYLVGLISAMVLSGLVGIIRREGVVSEWRHAIIII